VELLLKRIETWKINEPNDLKRSRDEREPSPKHEMTLEDALQPILKKPKKTQDSPKPITRSATTTEKGHKNA